MKEIIEMAEAHIQNVAQELMERKKRMEAEIEEMNKLKEYIEKGAKILELKKSEIAENAETAQETP